jgi:hypothetical protein
MEVKSEDSVSMDEEEERRARMERMVEDTERLEKMMGNEEERSRSKSQQRQPEEPKSAAKVRAMSPAVNRSLLKGLLFIPYFSILRAHATSIRYIEL